MHPLDSRRSQQTRHIPSRLEWKHSPPSSSLTTDSSLRSPATSCSSHDSFAESDVIMSSTASLPPSPPRSPLKQENSDPQLHAILPRRPLPQPDAHSSWVLPPITRRESSDGPLPGLSSILQVPRTPPAPHHLQGVSQSLNAFKLSPSPDVAMSIDYSHARSSRERLPVDPISHQLMEQWRERENQLQEEIAYFRSARNISQRDSPPALLRTAGTNHRYAHRYSPYTEPFSPKDPGRKMRRNDVPHNNQRYAQEEKHFIRYLKIDCGRPWEDIEYTFQHVFPADDMKRRRTQGVQGIYYRENKGLPKLDPRTNSIVYMPNGHMEIKELKCREQKAEETLFMESAGALKAFGLLNLFPEAALTYGWVREEDKRRIAGLAVRRREEREAAKRMAEARGGFQEISESGGCACCLDYKREKLSSTRRGSVPTTG